MRRPAAHVAAPLLAGLAMLAAAPAASAHIQVTPPTAAPGDPILFQLLVPNERSDATVGIDLKIPKGVLPFSFEDTPGWRRTSTKAADGSVDVVRWKGRLPASGFVRFSFLASTPEQTGELSWKAVQRYAGGTAVRWIGAPDSEEPAAVTQVTADAERQNAGGEGEAAAPATAGRGSGSTPRPAATAST